MAHFRSTLRSLRPRYRFATERHGRMSDAPNRKHVVNTGDNTTPHNVGHSNRKLAAARRSNSAVEPATSTVSPHGRPNKTHTTANAAGITIASTDDIAVASLPNGLLREHTGDFRYDAQPLMVDELEAKNVNIVNRTRATTTMGDDTNDDDSALIEATVVAATSTDGGSELHLLQEMMAMMTGGAEPEAIGGSSPFVWWRTLVVLLVFGVCAGIYSSKWQLITMWWKINLTFAKKNRGTFTSHVTHTSHSVQFPIGSVRVPILHAQVFNISQRVCRSILIRVHFHTSFFCQTL